MSHWVSVAWSVRSTFYLKWGTTYFFVILHSKASMLRDRPFNLKGWGYGFLFHSEFFFRTTRELELFFFCRAKREFFFQNVTLGYMTKTLNHIIFFFLHQNQNIFFSNIGNQNIFLEKNHIPPFKLNGRSLREFKNTNSQENSGKNKMKNPFRR